MMRHLRLAWVQLRVSAAAAMAYRSDFLLQALMEVVWMALALLPLIILYDERDSVAGWDQSSALILMAYFIGIRGVLEFVVDPSLLEFLTGVRTGAFDYVLLKPVDSQFMVSVWRFDYWKLLDLVGAIGVVIYAFVLRGAPPAPLDIVAGVVMFVSGTLAMYALWIICASIAFWVIRLDNLIFLLSSIFDAARWPVQVFRGTWRLVFTFAIPVAVMTTYPAMALLGRLDARTALASIGGSVGLLALSRVVWRYAIRNYTSASS